MANLSNYTEDLIATWLAGGAIAQLPTTLFLDLYSTMPDREAGTSGTSVISSLITGSVRLSLNNTANAFFVKSGSTIKNNEILITASASNSVNGIVGFAIWTLATGGSMLYSGNTTISTNVSAGQSIRFAPDAMVLTID
jgi:hypothetical protein